MVKAAKKVRPKKPITATVHLKARRKGIDLRDVVGPLEPGKKAKAAKERAERKARNAAEKAARVGQPWLSKEPVTPMPAKTPEHLLDVLEDITKREVKAEVDDRDYICENSLFCVACGTEIFSAHTHDFRYCRCGNVAVDGGQSYLRRVGGVQGAIDTSVVLKKSAVDALVAAVKWGHDTGRNDLGIALAVIRALRDEGLLAGYGPKPKLPGIAKKPVHELAWKKLRTFTKD